MGDHRDRSRSRSPKRHRDERRHGSDRRDRDRNRDREHHQSRSDRDRDRDRERDRDHRDRRDDHDADRHRARRSDRRDETEEERSERKRAKRERERDRGTRRDERRGRRRAEDGMRVVDDDEAGGDWVEKDMDTVVRTLARGADVRVRWARSRQPTHSCSRRVRCRTANLPRRPWRPKRRARAGCLARKTPSRRPRWRPMRRLPRRATSSPPSGRNTSGKTPTRRRTSRPR